MEFSFEGAATVATLDAVPEPLRAAYVEAEEGFTINPDLQGLATSIDKLNKSLRASRKDAADARKGNEQLAAWQTIGESPDTVQARLKELEEGAAKSADPKLNPDKIRAEVEATWKDKVDAAEAKAARAHAAVEKYLVQGQLSAELKDLNVLDGHEELLVNEGASQTKAFVDNGVYVIRIVDADNEIVGDGAGGFKTVQHLAKDLKVKYPGLFKGSGKVGHGVQPTDRRTMINPQERSATQKIADGLKSRGIA